MRFAILDAHGNVLCSWETGDLLRTHLAGRLAEFFASHYRFIPFRKKARDGVIDVLDAGLADLVHQLGVDVAKADAPLPPR